MAELNKLVIRRKEIMEKYGRPIRVLELFAGTGSVGKVCRKKGYEVISLDLQGADINVKNYHLASCAGIRTHTCEIPSLDTGPRLPPC